MKSSPLTAAPANLPADLEAALKAEYGELFIVEVKVTDTDTAVGYLKPADRNVVAYALQRIAKDQMLECGEFILQNCLVAGDVRLQITGQAQTPEQIAAAMAAVSLMKTLEATVKNA